MFFFYGDAKNVLSWGRENCTPANTAETPTLKTSSKLKKPPRIQRKHISLGMWAFVWNIEKNVCKKTTDICFSYGTSKDKMIAKCPFGRSRLDVYHMRYFPV